jgi:glutamine phosphoribosylpyrophosphate amidotransferase
MGNGEDTFYQKNKEFLNGLHPGYIGFESDTQCFLYTLHYVVEQLGWPLAYYKHVLTPLTFEEMNRHPESPVLQHIRQSCQHLEINGPNTVVFVLPDNRMGIVADAKKLRPLVIGRQDDLVAVASEVCGVNAVLSDRDYTTDIYPSERETVIINNRLEVEQWLQ